MGKQNPQIVYSRVAEQQYFIDKRDVVAMKDELENEMKLYLRGALKKMMSFKKDIKNDLLNFR